MCSKLKTITMIYLVLPFNVRASIDHYGIFFAAMNLQSFASSRLASSLSTKLSIRFTDRCATNVNNGEVFITNIL